MLSRTYTATIIGLQPTKIEVEVDAHRGTPSLTFIGLTSKATAEAKERLTAALQNCGFRIRSKRTIVNLAPAEIPKTSSHFDLAIAIGLLKMYGEISPETDQTMFFGELALDGQVKKIHGALPLVLAAKEMGYRAVVIPTANIPEVATLSGITIYPIAHLQEYLQWCTGAHPLTAVVAQPFHSLCTMTPSIDFTEIHGQETAKRAALIAAAGGHNLLLSGVPGSGKSMLAQALTSILPPLTEPEAIEVTKIYSVCGLLSDGLMSARPFRAPHHHTSLTGLLGGGNPVRPGEISLAHRGVLFMDELLEFPKPLLESLRQPLEKGNITLSRVHGSYTFPANFSLVAATNPCPCGFLYSRRQKCKCSSSSVDLYQKKLSGPLLDRIDLRVQVLELEMQSLQASTIASKKKLSSAELQTQTAAAQRRQARRFQKTPYRANSEVAAKDVFELCQVTRPAEQFLLRAAQQMSLSARSYFKILKVSRTIADLVGDTQVNKNHVAEALQYR